MNVYLKPAVAADGAPLVVPDPQSGLALAAGGEWKTRSTYWERRLRDGDVVAAEPPAEQGASIEAASAQQSAPGKSTFRKG